MNALSRTIRAWVAGCAAVLVFLAPVAVRAEIGVAGATGPANVNMNSIYLLGMTDDPDPILWSVLNPEGPGRFALNPQGSANGDGRPAILREFASGTPIVGWARNSGSGFDVVISRFTGGEWSEPEVVAGSSESERDPSLVQGPDGTVHLFYWIDAAPPRVMHRHAPADLSSWSVPVQISRDGEPACRPAAELHDGLLYVAYEVHDYGYGQTPRQIVLGRQEEDVFTPEIMAVTQNPGPVWPRVHSFNGRLWVDWIDAEGEMAWTRLNAQGHWEPPRYEPFTSIEQREYFVPGTIRFKAAIQP